MSKEEMSQWLQALENVEDRIDEETVRKFPYEGDLKDWRIEQITCISELVKWLVKKAMKGEK